MTSRLGRLAGQRRARGVGDAAALAADDEDSRRRRHDTGFELVAQSCHALRGVCLADDFRRSGAEADDAGNVLGAAAPATLLAAALDEGRQIDAVAHDQGADAARSAELVRGNDQRVGAELGEVHRQAPGRLHRVDVQRRRRARAPTRRPPRPAE